MQLTLAGKPFEVLHVRLPAREQTSAELRGAITPYYNPRHAIRFYLF